MKKILYCLAFISLPALGQFRPQHTQYLLNNYLLNPAITGIEEYVDVQTGYRSQWTGVEGAPQTLHLSVHAPVSGTGRYQGLNGKPTAHRQQPSLANRYRRNHGHHGLGGMIMSDQVGPFARQEMQLSYAYHLPVSRNTTLSAGLAGGWMRQRLNENQLVLTDPDDPTLATGGPNSGKPLVSLGMWAYGPNAYLGASVTQVFRAANQPESVADERMLHAYVTAGYRLDLSPWVALQPAALLRLSQRSPVAYDASLRVIWNQRAWLGGAYRSSREVSVLAGLHINELLSVAYAYDTSTGRFSQYSNGSHEVVLNLRLSNRGRVLCPQQLW